MARITAKDFNRAQVNNIEKVNNDFFIKAIIADSNGNFIDDFTGEGPTVADEITYIDDYTTSNVTYVGKATSGTATSAASWQIQKVDETTGVIVTWADGDDNFDNIWDNRASLSYS